MRLKALIIDDETKILDNLKQVLPWNELDIDVVALARNGVEGLEAMRTFCPDLVLCDIRMPIMDGIQFLEALWGDTAVTDGAGERPEVVMLTGYQEFEYARKVIRYGVRDYMLKPIDYDELTSVIERLAGSIRARRHAKQMEEQRYDRAARLAYEKRLHDRLLGEAAPLPHATLHGDERKQEAIRYAMLLASFDDYAESLLRHTEQERRLWSFAVRNVLTETLASEGERATVVQTREGELCVLIERDSVEGAAEAGGDAMIQLARLLQHAVAANTKISLSIGIYPSFVRLHELHPAFKSMQRHMHQASGERSSVLVCGGATAGSTAASGVKPSDRLMHAAADYIERHLTRDIGIDEVADSLGISASYFSQLFKQRYGSTFVEYVTAERIERAKSMLLMTGRSVTEIGRAVGYAQRRYFTKVFQKITGEIPSEYRERRQTRDTKEANEG